MEYVQLQQAVKNGAEVTDVEERNNRVYFKINNHEFQTFGNWVYPKGSPLFDHPVSDIWAKRENTAEGIEEDEKNQEESEKSWDLFQKHKASLYKLVMLRGLELMTKVSDEAGIAYIDRHFDIMENDDNCKKLLNMLENEI